jgi:hypothetical protein
MDEIPAIAPHSGLECWFNAITPQGFAPWALTSRTFGAEYKCANQNAQTTDVQSIACASG